MPYDVSNQYELDFVNYLAGVAARDRQDREAAELAGILADERQALEDLYEQDVMDRYAAEYEHSYMESFYD